MKQKIINNLISKGKKETSELLLLKTSKELQKNSLKKSKYLINTAIISAIPAFKMHKVVKKGKKKRIKEIPVIFRSMKTRVFSSIKFVLNTLRSKKVSSFYFNLYQEIIISAKNEGPAAQLKNEIQKQVLLKKHFFYYYR